MRISAIIAISLLFAACTPQPAPATLSSVTVGEMHLTADGTTMVFASTAPAGWAAKTFG
ncbi:MAG: hypothetical protein WEA61_06190 [Anaerolineales bacterium]